MLVLYQSQDTRCCVKCHQRTWRRTPSPPLALWLSLHVSLSIFARAHNFERTEQGSGWRGGGAGSSDERQWWRRCGTIHETSSIYWWREHIAQTQRAHHTGTLSFKFSLSLSTSPVSIRTEKAHIFATTWFPHEWTHSNTTNSKAPPSLNVSPITPPNPWRPNANKRQLNTRLINLSIIPHAFLCNLMNYWWAAISRLSCSCEVFAGGKLQIAQKTYKPNDVRCHPWPL